MYHVRVDLLIDADSKEEAEAVVQEMVNPVLIDGNIQDWHWAPSPINKFQEPMRLDDSPYNDVVGVFPPEEN